MTTLYYYYNHEEVCLLSRWIIGLTGAFGCGTSFLAEHFFEKEGFTRCSLSKILKSKYAQDKGEPHKTRHDLQEYGNELRSQNSAMLAELLDKEILEKNKDINYVIESIRNPAEIKYFRDKYPEFILIGVFADYEIRWQRVRESYADSKDKFDVDEQKGAKREKRQDIPLIISLSFRKRPDA